MTTVKVKFSPSAVKGKTGRVYYQVIHRRVVRRVATDYRIFSDEWDVHRSCIQLPARLNRKREQHLRTLSDRILLDLGRFDAIIEQCRLNGDYAVDDVVVAFKQQTDGLSFCCFMQVEAGRLKRLGKMRTAETYVVAMHSFLRFCNGNDLRFDELNGDILQDYEAWLKAKGACLNTVSFYMRILRANYNRAVRRGMIVQKNPFKWVYTGVERTPKRAVPLDMLKRIKALDLSAKPHLEFARNLFLFSFYTRGMSFIDMAYLKKTDLKDGILSYRRKKTGQMLTIKWERCMDELVARLATHPHSPYLLPVIVRSGADECKQYRNALNRMNRSLKQIAALVGLPSTLTSYVARHGWATAARSMQIPLAVISEGMGHDSEETTRIYLAALDAGVIDRANSLILGAL